ncbi:hypothetical protein MN202_20115 [Rheinheimera muenzenbergensis]|uniref:Uncharacterized protein n=1 Tax=Rheinheimera muenzenbergensis TaxID=1193628 RepID=A0ABU8CCH0_9GAMM
MGRKAFCILNIATRQHALSFLTLLRLKVSPKAYELVLNKRIYSEYRQKFEKSGIGDDHIKGRTNCSEQMMAVCQLVAAKKCVRLDNALSREFYQVIAAMEAGAEPEDLLLLFSREGKAAVIELCYLFSHNQSDILDAVIRFSRIILADELLAAIIVSYCFATKLLCRPVGADLQVVDALIHFSKRYTDLSLVTKELNNYFAYYLNYGYGFDLLVRKADAISRYHWFDGFNKSVVFDVIFGTRFEQLEFASECKKREFTLRFLLADMDLLNDNINYLEGEPSVQWRDGERGFHFVYTALNLPFIKITDEVPPSFVPYLIRGRVAPRPSIAT